MTTPLKCAQCGAENAPGPATCSACGASLRGASRVTPTTASAQGSGITCDKCHRGQMIATRIRRFSDALVAIGYTMMIIGALVIAGPIGCTMLTTASTVKNAATTLEQQRQKTLDDLVKIDGLPPRVISEFRTSGTVSDATINGLPTEQRFPVRLAIAGNLGATGGAAIATGVIGGMGLVAILGGCIVGLPLLIVGLIFTLKRSVWQCPTCWYVYDRAG